MRQPKKKLLPPRPQDYAQLIANRAILAVTDGRNRQSPQPQLAGPRHVPLWQQLKEKLKKKQERRGAKLARQQALRQSPGEAVPFSVTQVIKEGHKAVNVLFANGVECWVPRWAILSRCVVGDRDVTLLVGAKEARHLTKKLSRHQPVSPPPVPSCKQEKIACHKVKGFARKQKKYTLRRRMVLELDRVVPGAYAALIDKEGLRTWYFDVYLRSELWQAIRNRVLTRDNHRCGVCRGRAVVVHHKAYKVTVLAGDEDHYLLSLCDDCHHDVEFDDAGKKRPFGKARARLAALLKNQPAP